MHQLKCRAALFVYLQSISRAKFVESLGELGHHHRL